MPLEMFASRQFSAATTVGLLLNLGFYGELFVTTLYLQQHLGLSTLLAGVALLPQMAMAVVGFTASGIVMARSGPRLPMLAGLLLGAAGLFGLTAPGDHGPYAVLIAPFLAVGLGMSFTMPAATAAVMEAAPTGRAGLASGTLGVAVLGTLVARQQHFVAGLHLDMAIAGVAILLGASLSIWRI